MMQCKLCVTARLVVANQRTKQRFLLAFCLAPPPVPKTLWSKPEKTDAVRIVVCPQPFHTQNSRDQGVLLRR